MLMGNQPGACMSSTGITGTALHGTMPKNASVVRVKMLIPAAPPCDRIASRALTMCGASTESPATLRAK